VTPPAEAKFYEFLYKQLRVGDGWVWSWRFMLELRIPNFKLKLLHSVTPNSNNL